MKNTINHTQAQCGTCQDCDYWDELPAEGICSQNVLTTNKKLEKQITKAYYGCTTFEKKEKRLGPDKIIDDPYRYMIFVDKMLQAVRQPYHDYEDLFDMIINELDHFETDGFDNPKISYLGCIDNFVNSTNFINRTRRNDNDRD